MNDVNDDPNLLKRVITGALNYIFHTKLNTDSLIYFFDCKKSPSTPKYVQPLCLLKTNYKCKMADLVNIC